MGHQLDRRIYANYSGEALYSTFLDVKSQVHFWGSSSRDFN
jgi:hypothetical protein